MVNMANIPSNSNWPVDDLERGLAADLFSLSGLSVEDSQIGAYDMTYEYFALLFIHFYHLFYS